MNKYIIIIESSTAPPFYIGDKIGNGKIVELKLEELPNRVTAAWLSERFNLSKKTIIEKLRSFNKGDDNKHLYDPKEVMPYLENLNLITSQSRNRRKHST